MGETPLRRAVKRSWLKGLVQQLLEAGADIRTRDNRGKDLMAACNYEEIRLILRQYAARIVHRFDSET
jgi:hypothetical protein